MSKSRLQFYRVYSGRSPESADRIRKNREFREPRSPGASGQGIYGSTNRNVARTYSRAGGSSPDAGDRNVVQMRVPKSHVITTKPGFDGGYQSYNLFRDHPDTRAVRIPNRARPDELKGPKKVLTGIGNRDSHGDHFVLNSKYASSKLISPPPTIPTKNKPKRTKIKMKTFEEFITEALHGPKTPRETKRRRAENLSKILRKRLGLKSHVKTKGGENYNHPTEDPDDVSTEIASYKSPAHFAVSSSPKTEVDDKRKKVVTNSQRARRARHILRDITPHKNSTRPTHSIDLEPNLKRDHGDFENIKQRTKNLKNAAKNAPEHLKKAGAKTGDFVIVRPGQTQSGGPKEAGQKSRGKLYKSLYPGLSKISKTGIMKAKFNSNN